MPKPTSRLDPLNRALSKLGVLTRSRATVAILEGRVSVNGRRVRKPTTLVDTARARIEVDGEARTRVEWRTLMLNKPRGVVTTTQDPEGRPTVYSGMDEAARGLVTVGRLDLATTGLLLLTTDTALAAWLTDPVNAIPRLYLVTVRGLVTPAEAQRMEQGIPLSGAGGDRLAAESVLVRKASQRESHLTIELREGKNREVRRLCEAAGHEVTRLKRVAFGRLQLGTLQPGTWRGLTRDEIHSLFPGAPLLLDE